MNISGIRPFAGYYDYNTIKAAAQNNESVAQAKAEAKAPETQEAPAAPQEADAAKNQTFDAFNYAQLYRPEGVPELKGIDSDIKSLDMEKAISDMRKDQVLQQYQFFVRPNEGTAPASENFEL